MLAFGLYTGVVAQAMRVPRIWDDAALADWATPVAGLNIRPAHYSSAEYYAAPVDNLKTYPFYPPDREPAGYWEWLQKQKPEPLVDAAAIRTRADWIATGERAFQDMDAVLLRTSDPALIARARNPVSFENAATLPDGSFNPLRWVVTPQGLMLSAPACSACHASARGRSIVVNDEARAPDPEAAARRQPLAGAAATARRLQQFYSGDPLPVALWKEFTVPWAPDERVERLKTMAISELQALNGPERLGRSFSGGMFARSNGSPYLRHESSRPAHAPLQPLRRRDSYASAARTGGRRTIRRARDRCGPDGFRSPPDIERFTAAGAVSLCRRDALCDRHVPDVARAAQESDACSARRSSPRRTNLSK